MTVPPTPHIPPHLVEIQRIVSTIETNPGLSIYLTAQQYRNVLMMDARFTTYTQENLNEDLARYRELAMYYRAVKRRIIWEMRKKGFTYMHIARVFFMTPARVRAICDKEERAERRTK